MQLLTNIVIPVLFVLNAVRAFKTEAIIYLQKDNKQGYALLEGKRKNWRDITSLVYVIIGVIVGLNISLSILAPLIFGRIIFWILFDGLYATKVQKRSFWAVGFTGKLDRFIKTEKRSRFFKLSLLIISLAGYVANMIL